MIFSVRKTSREVLDCFDSFFNSSMVFGINMAMKLMFICFFFVFRLSMFLCLGSDTILNGQYLFPNQTIISNGRIFELGFFSPGNSRSYYVGIWYMNIPERTIVWVANRNNPINSLYNNSRLEMSNGNLYLYVNMKVRWALGTSHATEAVILDTGNFILRNASGIIWQSFDYPTDTWLPGGNLGYPPFSDVEAKLVSWKNPNDPTAGDYSLGIESTTGRELFIKLNSLKQWRSAVWQGHSFSSLPGGSNLSSFYNFSYLSRNGFNYFVYNSISESVVRIVMAYDGRLISYVLSEATQSWNVFWVEPSDTCKRYASCGPNAICDISASPPCSCLPGFVPQVVEAWNLLNFSDGCRREKPLSCLRDSFIKISGVRLPANTESLGVGRSSICEFACVDNCSCFAYAFSSDGGCLLFTGDLLDLQRLSNNTTGRDFYIRMESVSVAKKGNRNVRVVALVVSISVVTLACSIFMCYFWRKHISKVSRGAHQNLLVLDLSSDGSENNKRPADVSNNCGEEKNNKNDLPTFSFSSISAATNDFSRANKLGEGGFGPVYKGELLNGQFVAVKRLSKRSGQGLEEFKNETELIAKLQHRNLVGILGCCIENDEKILVYEYMPNKSLDLFLFDSKKKEVLDWGRRVTIIEGIAQGLLYLHHYSRFRIIHRDLKASNVLLDAEMNPRISDFGVARIFGGSDAQENSTRRIVGTYGYMSPEYAMDGVFSIKSDVFAFGVLMLEIISGKKNTGFYASEHLTLLGYGWNLWTNNRGLELVDPSLEMLSSSSVIPLRYIQIGLLCVQENPGDRPMMSDVVAMMSKEQIPVASPQHPAFILGRTLVHKSNPRENIIRNCSVNDMTMSLMEAR